MNDTRNTLFRIMMNINQNAPIGPTGNTFLLTLTEEEFEIFEEELGKYKIEEYIYNVAGNNWHVYCKS